MKITPRKGPKAKVKEDQNVDMQVARGRLKGLLNEIMEEPTTEAPASAVPNRNRVKRPKKDLSSKGPFVIKLFDRLVNVSQYDEDSPLYPICRDWFYDRTSETDREQSVDQPKTYYNGREPLLNQLQKGRIDRVAALPPPNDDIEVQRIPFCEPPSIENGLHLFTEDYDWDNPQVTTEDLTVSYLDRWVKVRAAWKQQSLHYQERYADSAKILDAIKKA